MTTFTAQKLQKVQRAVDISYKPKMGLNKNFSKTVVQGPNLICGLAHPPFYTQQGHKQIQLMMGTITNKDGIVEYIKVSLELGQIEAGYTTPLLSLHTSQLYLAPHFTILIL